MTHGSLFSGIGGFDYAAEKCGIKNIFTVEINEFCNKILEKNYPDVQRFTDITSFNGLPFRGSVDIISGGFPCQPFSQAGKRKGREDERALFPEALRVIREVRPEWVVLENVFGIVNIHDGEYFEEVCSQMEDEGYTVQPFIIPASAVNAPTDDIESGLLPTPMQPGNGGTNGKKKMKEMLLRTPDANMERGNRTKENLEGRMNKGMPLNLNDQMSAINYGLLPAPNSSDCHNANLANGHDQKKGYLRGVIALIPTPRASDCKGDSRQTEAKGRNPMTNSCCDAIENGIGTGLKLQPGMVEWMMGFPPNYTNLKLPTEWVD